MRTYQMTTKDQKRLILLDLIRDYYEYEGVGGTLHVVLDDGNYDAVESCLEFAKEKNDQWGVLIATLLLDFTEEEIEQIVEKPWEVRARWDDSQSIENYKKEWSDDSLYPSRYLPEHLNPEEDEKEEN